jgi:thymidylate synthase (FAD)
MIDAWISYKYLLDKGYKPEIARYVLPNACMTEIICTWNFREIRHIIELRTSNAALPEMREVAGKIKDIIKEKCPKIFGDLK